MSPDYVTAYKISMRSSDWAFAFAGMIPLLLGALIAVGKYKLRWKQPRWVFVGACRVFGLVWCLTVGFSVISSDRKAITSYEQGKYSLVEGIVTDFRPMPYEGHQDECFSVGTHRFCYSDYGVSPGFHNAASHGGPIREGLPVRVAYLDGDILRLDVARGQAPTSNQATSTANFERRQSELRLQNDPFTQRMTTAFLIMAVLWTTWWNAQWKRLMRLWVKLPYRPITQYGFRGFFALSLIGSIVRLIEHLQNNPIHHRDMGSTLGLAGVLCLLVGMMTEVSLQLAKRRDRKDVSPITI
jgi:hypothetical protein